MHRQRELEKNKDNKRRKEVKELENYLVFAKYEKETKWKPILPVILVSIGLVVTQGYSVTREQIVKATSNSALEVQVKFALPCSVCKLRTVMKMKKGLLPYAQTRNIALSIRGY